MKIISRNYLNFSNSSERDSCIICKSTNCKHYLYINDAENINKVLSDNFLTIEELMNYIKERKILPDNMNYKKYNNVYITIIDFLYQISAIRSSSEKYYDSITFLFNQIQNLKERKENYPMYFLGNYDERSKSRTVIKKEFADLLSTTISTLVCAEEDKEYKKFLLQKARTDNYTIFNHVLKLEDLIENYKITNKYNFAFKKACIEFYSNMEFYNSKLLKNDAEFLFELLSYSFRLEKPSTNSIKYGSKVNRMFDLYKKDYYLAPSENRYKINKEMINDLLMRKIEW
jgi:hypothetical protein